MELKLLARLPALVLGAVVFFSANPLFAVHPLTDLTPAKISKMTLSQDEITVSGKITDVDDILNRLAAAHSSWAFGFWVPMRFLVGLCC